MAKITFTKLGLKKQDKVEVISIESLGASIEVKQYLPINEKADLIARVISGAHDKNFANPIKVEILGTMEIIMAYTNISFTDKQKEDIAKIYDLMEENGLINTIIAAIPRDEYDFIIKNINATIEAVYGYENSVLGILESVQKDYSNLNLDATEIQETLANPENMKLLKTVVTKLG